MTAPERIGARLPELLEELGAPRVPDYFDDLLRTTAATRQRPGWASLERWLPVTSITRPAPLGLPSWQLVVAIVALLLAAAIGGVLLIGGQPHVPAPFGPARNGVLLASSLDGTLLAIDPAAASASAFGPAPNRFYPLHSPDGLHMAYVAKDTGTDPRSGSVLSTLLVAKADGSDAMELLTDASNVSWLEWAPSGRELLVLTTAQDAWLFDVTTGIERGLDFRPLQVAEAHFRPSGELVFSGHDPTAGTWAFYVASLGEAAPKSVRAVQARALTGPFDAEQWGSTLSPDGTTLAYANFAEQPGVSGQIHLVDVETGTDRAVAVSGYEGVAVSDMNPLFSPDGRWLLVNRFDADAAFGAPVLVRIDGGGDPIRLHGRPTLDADQAPEAVFSPDGEQLALRYPEDESVWIYSTATGEGRQVQGITADGLSWQRQ